jgi:hypothetical protein
MILSTRGKTSVMLLSKNEDATKEVEKLRYHISY